MDNDHVAPQAVWLDNAYDGFDDPAWASIDPGPVLGRASDRACPNAPSARAPSTPTTHHDAPHAGRRDPGRPGRP